MKLKLTAYEAGIVRAILRRRAEEMEAEGWHNRRDIADVLGMVTRLSDKLARLYEDAETEGVA